MSNKKLSLKFNPHVSFIEARNKFVSRLIQELEIDDVIKFDDLVVTQTDSRGSVMMGSHSPASFVEPITFKAKLRNRIVTHEVFIFHGVDGNTRDFVREHEFQCVVDERHVDSVIYPLRAMQYKQYAWEIGRLLVKAKITDIRAEKVIIKPLVVNNEETSDVARDYTFSSSSYHTHAPDDIPLRTVTYEGIVIGHFSTKSHDTWLSSYMKNLLENETS